MSLFGSEYWTYSLPRRVGQAWAERLTGELQAVNTHTAKKINLVDDVCSLQDAPLTSEQIVLEYVSGLRGGGAPRETLDMIVAEEQAVDTGEFLQRPQSQKLKDP